MVGFGSPTAVMTRHCGGSNSSWLDGAEVPPPPSQPVADRAPDELAGGVAAELRRELEELLGADRVLHRVSDLLAYASDASPYRRFPRAVVEARDTDDVAAVLGDPELGDVLVEVGQALLEQDLTGVGVDQPLDAADVGRSCRADRQLVVGGGGRGRIGHGGHDWPA